MSRKYYVYAYYNPTTMQPFYIGKGFGKRDQWHLNEAKKWDHVWRKGVNNTKLQTICDIWEDGYNPTIIRMFESDDHDAVLAEEKRLISIFGKQINGTGILTNITDGADGGFPGELNGMFGKTHTNESRDKMSAQRRGKPGHKHSKEHRDSMIGNNHNVNTRKPVYAIKLDGKVVVKTYASLTSAIDCTGIPKSTMCSNICPDGLPIGDLFYRYDTVVVNPHELISRRTAAESNQRNTRQVQQILNNEVINVYTSITQASAVVKSLGGNYGNLWLKIKQGKPYVGYYWRYC